MASETSTGTRAFVKNQSLVLPVTLGLESRKALRSLESARHGASQAEATHPEDAHALAREEGADQAGQTTEGAPAP